MNKTKRYTEAIQVGTNVTDIMRLPCVEVCQKTIVERRVERGGTVAIEDDLVLRYTLDNTQQAYEGDWIVRWEDGQWQVLSDREWQQRGASLS